MPKIISVAMEKKVNTTPDQISEAIITIQNHKLEAQLNSIKKEFQVVQILKIQITISKKIEQIKIIIKLIKIMFQKIRKIIVQKIVIITMKKLIMIMSKIIAILMTKIIIKK